MRFQVQIIGALLVGVMLVGGGCAGEPVKPTSTASVPEGYKVHDATNQYFTIAYPPTWEDNQTEIEGSDYEALFYAPYENDADQFAENVSVNEIYIPGHKMTLQQYYDSNMADIETDGQYKKVGSTDITVDGYPGKRFEATRVSETAGQIRFIQAYALTPDYAYLVTCTMVDKVKDQYIETCDKMIGSLKFR